MGSVNIKIKIMPSSVDADLKGIEKKAKKKIESKGGGGTRFEEEPVAFGLKAIIVMFVYPEEKSLDSLENELGKIENVSSVQVIDMRRAL